MWRALLRQRRVSQSRKERQFPTADEAHNVSEANLLRTRGASRSCHVGGWKPPLLEPSKLTCSGLSDAARSSKVGGCTVWKSGLQGAAARGAILNGKRPSSALLFHLLEFSSPSR